MKLLIFLLTFACSFALGARDAANYVIPRGINGQDFGVDAFGRLETGKPFTLGDYVFTYSAESTLFGTSVTNAAEISYHTTNGVVQLKTTTDGDVAIFQSHIYHRYQAGKAGKAVFSLAPGETVTGTKKWGYFDDDNGLFFKLDPDGFYVCQRSSAAGTETTPATVDTCVESENFNGSIYSSKVAVNDFLDDTSKTTPFEIAFQWLGSGNVSFFIEGDNGHNELLHTFKNPLDFDRPYMRTAVLPMRFESTGGAGAVTEETMNIVCCSILSSGGEDPPEFAGAATMSATTATASAAEIPIFAIRLKETYQGRDNRVLVFPRQLNFSALTAGATFKVYRNATIDSTWTDVGDYSAVEHSNVLTSCTGGQLIATESILTASQGNFKGFGSGQSGFRKLYLSRNAFNTDSDNICVTVTRTSGTNATVKAGISWGEVR